MRQGGSVTEGLEQKMLRSDSRPKGQFGHCIERPGQRLWHSPGEAGWAARETVRGVDSRCAMEADGPRALSEREDSGKTLRVSED